MRPVAVAPRGRALELAHDVRGRPTVEAFVERVRRGDAQVEAELVLADGSEGIAHVETHEWDWHDVHAGDIVRVRPAQPAGLSA